MSDVNVMIDLETLSSKKTAAIISIGAVKFNDTEIVDKFYINLDYRSQSTEYGLHISKSTVDWWKEQKQAAWEATKNNRVQIEDGLTKFREWYGPKSYPTWSCGVDFDIVILENVFDTVEGNSTSTKRSHSDTVILENVFDAVEGNSPPWKWSHSRCFRTFKELFKIEHPRDGVHHNALDDAIYQAQYMQKVLKK